MTSSLKKATGVGIAAGVALGLAAGSASGSVLVDDFTDPDGAFGITVFGATNVSETTEPDLGMFGQERVVTVNTDNAQNPFVAGSVSDPGLGMSFMSAISHDALVGAVHGLSYSDFSGVDASNGGLNDQLQLSFVNIDHDNALDVTVTINGASASASSGPNGSFNMLFNESDFSGVSFSSLDSIDIDMETTVQGTDFSLNSVSFVPEPGTIGLFAAGGLLFLRRYRR